ncbi:MAG: amidohydrolase family protein [Thaumarchaeota archaeon]|nr:amidohydrolase family protein [Nitrososphaerota archaeon]
MVFGSDYPFLHHSVELQRIQMAGLTREEMERALYDNAASCLV